MDWNTTNRLHCRVIIVYSWIEGLVADNTRQSIVGLDGYPTDTREI